MNYEKYQHRQKGAGSRTFFLVRHWTHDGFKVRELTKGHSSEKPVEEFHFRVRGVDPASTLPDGESVRWDGQPGEKPISHPRARPQNKEEMIRADNLLDRRQQEVRGVPDGTPAGVRVRSDIHFLKAVKAEFRLWFIDSGFKVPDEVTEDRSEPKGCYYGRELYDYLDLHTTPPKQVGYQNLKEIWRDIRVDRPKGVSICYNGFYKALKNAELYPSDPDSDNNYDKLIELLVRIVEFVEDGERPM